jgi:hypothetical protein
MEHLDTSAGISLLVTLIEEGSHEWNVHLLIYRLNNTSASSPSFDLHTVHYGIGDVRHSWAVGDTNGNGIATLQFSQSLPNYKMKLSKMVDFDGDGDVDQIVCGDGPQTLLLSNEGSGSFRRLDLLGDAGNYLLHSYLLDVASVFTKDEETTRATVLLFQVAWESDAVVFCRLFAKSADVESQPGASVTTTDCTDALPQPGFQYQALIRDIDNDGTSDLIYTLEDGSIEWYYKSGLRARWPHLFPICHLDAIHTIHTTSTAIPIFFRAKAPEYMPF